MALKDRQLNSMAFQALKMKFLWPVRTLWRLESGEKKVRGGIIIKKSFN